MARQRQLNPEAPTDEDVAQLSIFARYAWAYLPCHADREGRLPDKPFSLKLAILPTDDVDMNALLGEMVTAGFIVRYQVEGRRYIQIRSFKRHQKPHPNEAGSKIPGPPSQNTPAEVARLATMEVSAVSLGAPPLPPPPDMEVRASTIGRSCSSESDPESDPKSDPEWNPDPGDPQSPSAIGGISEPEPVPTHTPEPEQAPEPEPVPAPAAPPTPPAPVPLPAHQGPPPTPQPIPNAPSDRPTTPYELQCAWALLWRDKYNAPWPGERGFAALARELLEDQIGQMAPADRERQLDGLLDACKRYFAQTRESLVANRHPFTWFVQSYPKYAYAPEATAHVPTTERRPKEKKRWGGTDSVPR